jgi:hypothetical protein
MRIFFMLLGLGICCSTVLGQTSSREEKLAQIKELNSKIEKIVDDLILPSADDLKQAAFDHVNAGRLNPREIYGRIAVPQEGGAFYSFSTGSHDYQKTSQLLLEQNYLSTGFAGADYGLIGELGDIPLSDVDEKNPEIAFLMQYGAPGNILDARVEQRKSRELIVGDLSFHSRVKALIGRTYVLRAISFDQADILVAFRTIRKDTDGSVIIFWKTLAEFPKPTLDRNSREN